LTRQTMRKAVPTNGDRTFNTANTRMMVMAALIVPPLDHVVPLSQQADSQGGGGGRSAGGRRSGKLALTRHWATRTASGIKRL
jgi:hypothetical protein